MPITCYDLACILLDDYYDVACLFLADHAADPSVEGLKRARDELALYIQTLIDANAAGLGRQFMRSPSPQAFLERYNASLEAAKEP
jgi:hypothetical protein